MQTDDRARGEKSAYCSPFAPKIIFYTLHDHINTLYNKIKNIWFGLGMLVIAPVEKIMIDKQSKKVIWKRHFVVWLNNSSVNENDPFPGQETHQSLFALPLSLYYTVFLRHCI